MRQPILLTALIFSGLAANAQNLTNVQVLTVNYPNTQQLTNYNPSNDLNPSYEQFAANEMDIQVKGNPTNKQNNIASNSQLNLNNTVNDNNPYRGGNRGNNFDINDNVLDNNVGKENLSRGRGGNTLSNPVVNDHKKIVSSKPVVQDAPGLNFKPSGLSGRDYSNGGKLKKGQKNFYKGSTSKHKTTIHKRKPKFKKVKHHTSRCPKW